MAPPKMQASRSLRYGFLLLPNASMADFAIASEVLTCANQLAENRCFECLSLSLDGQPVTLLGGQRLPVELPLSHAPRLDALFILASDTHGEANTDEISRAVNQSGNEKLLVAAIGCGSYWLARAGLLTGFRATIHWQEIGHLSEDYPEVIVSSNLFEIDRNRASCAGGAATLDFMISLVSAHLGGEFAARLSERFSMERIRPGNERQRIPLATRIGGSQPKLTEAVSLMEANIEEPLSTDDIAFYVGVSRRQLERLFKQYLNTVPSKYYLELRLNRARQLLQQTSKSIVQIGLACGFSSGPHFSSTYRNHFNITPREERAQHANQHSEHAL